MAKLNDGSSKEQHLFKIEIFSNIINVSLLKSITALLISFHKILLMVMYMAGQFLQNTGRWGKKWNLNVNTGIYVLTQRLSFFMYSTWYISVDFTLGLKLCVGRMCSCWARGVPQGWYSLKHSLQKLDLQSAQPLLASRA